MKVAPANVIERLLTSYRYTVGDITTSSIKRDEATGLFGLLCVSMLSAPRRVTWSPLAAFSGLKERGWHTPERLAAAPWRQKVRILNEAGYDRSPERTALMLTRLGETVRDRYGGDLRNLREEAEHDPVVERSSLKVLKGMNDHAVDLFFREAQSVWDELFPFADEVVLHAAKCLGLPTDAAELAELTGRERFPRLVAALGHVDRAQAYDAFSGASARVIDLREYSAETTKLRGAS